VPGKLAIPQDRVEGAITTNAQASPAARRRRKSGLTRAVRWLAFLPLASRAPTYAGLIWALLRDPRVPTARKAVLGLAAGYVLLGRDLISDDIPLLGSLDDLAVVVLAVELFFDGIPEDVLQEKLDELELDAQAFRRDMGDIRRVTPAPLRRAIRRLPDALDSAGRLIAKAEIGPKVRSFISKEESFA
jgi:uncharacterized membrane protein YkvA (DUF1232 family)